MSILDHSHNYSTMEYNDNSSSHLGGKFFWFSGYCDMGLKDNNENRSTKDNSQPLPSPPRLEKPVEQLAPIKTRRTSSPCNHNSPTQKTSPSCSPIQNGDTTIDSIESFEEEVERNINIVNGLLAELGENGVHEPEIKRSVVPTVLSEIPDHLGNLSRNNSAKKILLGDMPKHKSKSLERKQKEKSLERKQTEKSLERKQKEKNSRSSDKEKRTKTPEAIPVKRLWFRYNDDPIVDTSVTTNKIPSPRTEKVRANSHSPTNKESNSAPLEETYVSPQEYASLENLPYDDEVHIYENLPIIIPKILDSPKQTKQPGVFFKLQTKPDERPKINQSEPQNNQSELLSSIDDLITEVKAPVLVPILDEKTLRYHAGPPVDDPPAVESEPEEDTSNIPTLESLEAALAEIERQDRESSCRAKTIEPAPVVETVPSVTHVNNVEKTPEYLPENNNSDNISNERIHNNDNDDEAAFLAPMTFGPGIFFKLHVAKPAVTHPKCKRELLSNDRISLDYDKTPKNDTTIKKVSPPKNTIPSDIPVRKISPPKNTVPSNTAKTSGVFFSLSAASNSSKPIVPPVSSEIVYNDTPDLFDNTIDLDNTLEAEEIDYVKKENMKNSDTRNQPAPYIRQNDLMDAMPIANINRVPPAVETHVPAVDEDAPGDESFQIGTWFGVAGRTYRSRPMQNLLDIDAMEDESVSGRVSAGVSTGSKSDVRTNSPSLSSEYSSAEIKPYSFDFKERSLNDISGISEISDSYADTRCNSSVGTNFTSVTPLSSVQHMDSFKLSHDSSLDDEVFVESKVTYSNRIQRQEPVFSEPDAVVQEAPIQAKEVLLTEHEVPLEQDMPLVQDMPTTDLEENEDSISIPVDAIVNQTIDSIYCNSESDVETDVDKKPVNDVEKATGIRKIFDESDDSKTYVNIKVRNVVNKSDTNDQESDFVNSYLTESKEKRPRALKQNSADDDNQSFVDTSDDEISSNLGTRGTSFRRSIVIEDEVNSNHSRQSSGAGGVTHVSAFYYTPSSVKDSPSPKSSSPIPKNTKCAEAKELLNYLDNIVLSETTFGRDFEIIKKLHSLFWELKDDDAKAVGGNSPDSLNTVLNYMVVQEWPKVFVSVFKKLKLLFSHVFQEHDPEHVIYYSGHMPSILRMNRTSPEFCVAVIFDGLLKSAIHFTDVHEASRQASCEDDLIGYLLEDIMPHLHSILWGKATAKEMFLKSICDLIYNCCQSPSNASYMIENDLVNIFTTVRDEIKDVVDARKVNMTMLLSLSYLIDDNSYYRIIPDESSVLTLLQFLDKSLEHSEHMYFDFSSFELASCLSKIAAHHSSKTLIARNSGQEILHKLLKYAYNDEEKIAACEALWNIAFSREAKQMLRGMGKLTSQLRDLQASDDLILSNAASGVLWECEEKYDIKGKRHKVATHPQHIMISYEYESQPLVISIRDELEQLGFNVWMTSENDENSLEDIMTHGVEEAAVVIVAVTRKYKQEPYTFSEVDYAHSLRKTIIPLIIDMDFTPDGWLAQHMRKEKTFDFSRRSMFNGSLDALVEHLKTLDAQREDDKTVKINITEKGATKDRATDVLEWSNSNVVDWLIENRLIRTTSGSGRLQKLTGFHLLMFYDLKKETPDYYYSVLDSHLGFKDVLDTLEFTYALDRLLQTERLI